MTTNWRTTYTGFDAFFNNGADPNVTDNELAKVKNKVSGDVSTKLHEVLDGGAHASILTYSDTQVTLSVAEGDGPPSTTAKGRDRNELESLRYLEADRTFQFDFHFSYAITNSEASPTYSDNTSVDVVLAQLNQPHLGEEISGHKPAPVFALSLKGSTLTVVIGSTIGSNDATKSHYTLGTIAKDTVYTVSTEFRFDSRDPRGSFFNVNVAQLGGTTIWQAQQEDAPDRVLFGNYKSATPADENFYDGKEPGEGDGSEVGDAAPPHLRIGPYRNSPNANPSKDEEIAVTYSNFVARAEDNGGPIVEGDGGPNLIEGDAHLDFRDGETQFGFAGDDTLQGDVGHDTLNGGVGNDHLQGLGGNDQLLGGDGNDTMLGNAGDDTLYGNNGRDRMFGEAGADLLHGGSGIDTLYGAAGADTLTGGDDGDFLSGGDDADELNGGAGSDTLNGNEDDDTLNGNSGGDSLRR